MRTTIHRRPSPFATTLAACAASVLATPAVTQAPSAWSTLSPPGGVQPAAIETGETLVCYRDGQYMRVYSAHTRQWHAHLPSFGTTVQVRNHLVAVPESDRWTLFSPYRGTFEVLYVDVATTTWDSSETVFVVRDGDTAHVFSAIRGAWSSHPIPTGWNARIEERIVTIADDTVSGPSEGAAIFDAYRGQWLDIPAQTGGLRVHTGTGTALVMTDTASYGYSTQRGTLETLPPAVIQGGNTFGAGFDDLVGQNGNFYWGLTGAVTTPPYAVPNPWWLQTNYNVRGHVVRAQQQNHPTRYVAGPDGNWHAVPASALPNGDGRMFAIYENGNDVHAFHALTGTWATRTFPGGISMGLQTDDVAIRVDATSHRLALFSGITGQWHDAPNDVLPESGPSLATQLGDGAAVMPTSTGLLGFSAIDGSFTPLAATGAVPVGGDRVVGASGGGNLHLFDAPRRRWISEPLATGGSIMAAGQVLMQIDGNAAIAFGARAGRAERLTASSAILASGLVTGSETDIAWVRTADDLHVFTAIPEHFSWTGAPFGPACSNDTLQRHQLQISQGDLALFGLGTALVAAVPIGTLGDLWLDPATSATALLVGNASEARVLLDYQIPSEPTLRGTEWFAQPLLWRAGGQPYLADATSFVIL